jgi:hypothetical protein
LGKKWAKVDWAIFCQPIVKGGLSLTNPNTQSKALLVKLLIRGLSLGAEPWKDLLKHRAE